MLIIVKMSFAYQSFPSYSWPFTARVYRLPEFNYNSPYGGCPLPKVFAG
jgi:hypothetical protein